MAEIPLEMATWRWHLRWLLAQALGNAAVMAWVGRSYLARLPEDAGAAGWWSVLAAWLGVCVAISVTVAALAAPAVLIARRAWLTFGALPALFLAMQVAIYADTVVYGLFRYHLNGVVWHLVTTEGSSDSWAMGGGTALRVALSITALAVVVFAAPLIARRRVRPPLIWASLALIALVATGERLVHAWSPHARLATSALPLYDGDAWRRFARSALGWQVEVGDAIVPDDPRPLAYPRRPLTFAPDAERLNVVLVAVECGRSDMLDPEVMPHLHAWSRAETVCADHWSGGHCTRFGLAAALFGFDGACFAQALAHRTESALIAALRARGYDCDMRSCGKLTYPELRQTAFVGLPEERMRDEWDGERVDRDRDMTDAFVAGLDQRPRPFFSFLFYDASHQPYLYPPEHARFAPATDLARLDYVAMSQDTTAAAVRPLFNRYRNSLRYVDAQIARVIAALDQAGELDRTIVAVFGDHGEEFGECGHVGHAIAYTPWQCRSFCVLHLPGEPARVIERPTSHVDLLPTILMRLGVANPVGDYSVGEMIGAGTGPRSLVLSGWNDAAVVDDDGIVVFATAAGCMDITAYDRQWRRRPTSAARTEQLLTTLERLNAFRR
ncbi:MAG TPA: sulfatase-like hydrolase/transferase [Planctomycetota bacterium]|nr:sulfatase-like hydrolase/transferase [Planctomycetota bacterium]